jgi:hypothetical protein
MRGSSILSGAVLAVFIVGTIPAVAEVILPVSSYNMPNGDGTHSLGDFNYWDGTYSGSGAKTTDGAPLSGGKGALTDGIIATQGYGTVSNDLGTGQYVGWKYTNPQIVFNLTNLSKVDSISFFVDNSYVGLVGAPATITVDGHTYTPIVSHPFGPGPAEELIVAFAQPITASVFDVQLNAGPFGPDAIAYNKQFPNSPIPGHNEPWMMLSEVQFNGVSAVPEPSTWVLMLIGFAAIGYAARRRQKLAVAT